MNDHEFDTTPDEAGPWASLLVSVLSAVGLLLFILIDILIIAAPLWLVFQIVSK